MFIAPSSLDLVGVATSASLQMLKKIFLCVPSWVWGGDLLGRGRLISYNTPAAL